MGSIVPRTSFLNSDKGYAREIQMPRTCAMLEATVGVKAVMVCLEVYWAVFLSSFFLSSIFLSFCFVHFYWKGRFTEINIFVHWFTPK